MTAPEAAELLELDGRAQWRGVASELARRWLALQRKQIDQMRIAA
jgi:hypothetical protein